MTRTLRSSLGWSLVTLSTIGAPLSVTAACGGSSGAPAAGAVSESKSPGASGIQSRLQGTWEIVRYVSRDPIPSEAMPLMGEMFEDMRLSVHDSAFQIDGKDSPFEVVSAEGDKFRLKTGGMFDNADCRINEKGEWEIDDQGPTWPGTTVLKKTK